MLVVEYFHQSLIHSQLLVLRCSSKKTHLPPFRKTRQCQRYNNSQDDRVQPLWIQNVLEELTPVPEAGLTSAAVPVF